MKVNGEREIHTTPCIGKCSTTNLGDAVCVGCGRTAKEVIEWNGYSRAQKTSINKRLQGAGEKKL